MKVAIVGSRHYPDLEAVRRYVESLPADTVIITGGASGVDETAASWAHQRRMRVEIIHPDWKRYGTRAGPMRNTEIVERCDRLVAFWDTESVGTKDSIRKARSVGKPVEVYAPNGVREKVG